MQQEELAQLFSAHMNLSKAHPQPIAEVQQQQQQQPQPQPAHQSIVYASQHYTHSYHVASTRHAEQKHDKTYIQASEFESILLRNSIDPSLLFPSQVQLFLNADDGQKLRLLELWRISPPQGQPGHPSRIDYNTSRHLYDWPPTSMAQEEAMVKLKDDAVQEERIQLEEIQMHQQQLDQSMDQSAESAAVLATQNTLPEQNAEPYMVSGYDMLAKRDYDASAMSVIDPIMQSTKYNHATDPVYNLAGGNGRLWEKSFDTMLDMENQYGAFACARDHDVRPLYVEDEMIM